MTPPVTPEPSDVRQKARLVRIEAHEESVAPWRPELLDAAAMLDALADLLEARAARPSPTCATCRFYAQTADPAVKVCINESEIDGGPNDWYVLPTFSCNQHEPAPPAQDGGQP